MLEVTTAAERLIDWLTHDLGETESTMSALYLFLSDLNNEEFENVQQVYDAWNNLVEVWKKDWDLLTEVWENEGS